MHLYVVACKMIFKTAGILKTFKIVVNLSQNITLDECIAFFLVIEFFEAYVN